MEKFIQGNIPLRLPVKEARLFKKLKQHLGQVVSKEAIFNLLWPEDSQDYDKASEWALNSLIYRLRKNPYFIQSGYVIENHKKEGFVLIKNYAYLFIQTQSFNELGVSIVIFFQQVLQ